MLRRSAAPRHHGAGRACDSIVLPRVRNAHRRRRGPPRGAQERRARFEYVPSRRRWRDPVPCVSRGTIRPTIAHPIITSRFLVANNALLPPLVQRGCWCGNNVTPLVRKIPHRRGQRNRAMQTQVIGFGTAHTSRDPSFCMLHQPLPPFAPQLREHSPACAAAQCDWSGQPGTQPPCAPHTDARRALRRCSTPAATRRSRSTSPRTSAPSARRSPRVQRPARRLWGTRVHGQDILGRGSTCPATSTFCMSSCLAGM